MKIGVRPFSGRVPIIADKNLQPYSATVAKNCDLEEGKIKPIKDILYDSDLSGGYVIDSTGAYVVEELDTGSITAFADYSGTVAGTVKATSAGHGLNTGDDVDQDTVSGDFEGIYSITKIDADNYYFTATWTATTTGTWRTFDYLIAASAGYFYNLNGNWLKWQDPVHVVQSFLDGASDRIYYSGDGYPKQTTETLATSGDEEGWPTDYYTLGIPAPTTALSVAINGTGTTTAPQDVSYVYTYVTSYGEESAPSPPSENISVATGESVDISGFVALSGSIYNIAGARVYKLNAGNSLADYELIVELTINSSTEEPDYDIDDLETYGANDDTDLDDLEDSLETEGFLEPPSDLEFLSLIANGTLAGISGNYMCMCEPYYPYAWPIEYRKSFSGTFVAAGSYDENYYILTDRKPWQATGYHPSSITPRVIEKNWPCLSAQGAVSTDVGVFYPTVEGMAKLSATENIIATAAIFSKQQWEALDRANMMSFYWGGRVYVLIKYTNSGFWFDPLNPTSVMNIELPSPYVFWGGSVAGEDFYVVIKNELAISIYEWEGASTDMTFTWWSKEFWFGRDMNLSAARVVAESYDDLTFMLECDGTTELTKSITSSGVFRLPSGFKYGYVRLGVTGTDVVEIMAAATSVKELIENG